MTVAYLTHPDFARHAVPSGHAERPERVAAVHDALQSSGYLGAMLALDAPLANETQLRLAHPESYLRHLEAARPADERIVQLDPDTFIGPHSLTAAQRAAGAICHAIDLALDGSIRRAFCNVRPPGHHAEAAEAMGFCLYSSVAIGALHAIRHHGLQRVLVVDFDVHFGNGTAAILRDRPEILLLGSCQYPLYPLEGRDPPGQRAQEHNIILAPGSDGSAFRSAVAEQWWPALDAFSPELVLISAGFDAHAADPLAQLRWQAEDYAWITRELCARTQRSAQGRVISSLEGGYDLDALGACATAHVGALLEDVVPLPPT